MAEKRLREESIETEEEENSKRYKPYDHILSILEEEEEEPNTEAEGEMVIFTTLQQELSSSSESGLPVCDTAYGDEAGPAQQVSGPTSPCSNEEADRIDVIRHLLEASDDELGIPNRGMDGGDNAEENGITDGQDFAFSLCDGLWEFEDETANYYSLLQSELFM